MTLMFINVHAIASSLMTLYVNKSCALKITGITLNKMQVSCKKDETHRIHHDRHHACISLHDKARDIV